MVRGQELARERLVYAVSAGGHRQSYLDTLGALFGLEPVSGPINAAMFRRLLAADRLLFASLDDHMLSFGVIAAARSLLGRRSAALFLRAQKCFDTGRWYYPLKRLAFRTVRRLPRLTVASIIPFDIAPRHAEVAHRGVFDPQYWDLYDGGTLRRPGRTALSDEVRVRAAGRNVLCVIGALSENKGLGFLDETLERFPDIAEHTLVVAAGRTSEHAKALTARLSVAGAMVVDRFITDAELESLYGVAHGIWACYAPDYDQASGVFGRAIQLGVPPVVRKDSLIATFAVANGLGCLPVAYGAYEDLADLLRRSWSQDGSTTALSQGERESLVGDWRRQFVETIGKGVGCADGYDWKPISCIN
jgi:hypothetical protein